MVGLPIVDCSVTVWGLLLMIQGLLWFSGGLGTVVDIPGMVGTAEDSPRMVE